MRCFRRRDMPSKRKIEWLKAICPYCRRKYDYPKDGYKPSTCGDYNCVRKHLHPELRNGIRG